MNTNTSLVVNVVVGWLCYFLAAVFAEQAVWPGLATMVVSIGNTIAHTTIFNIKGKTLYNAGLATSWLLFVPCSYFFFQVVHLTRRDYLIGIPLGIALNVIGIIKLMTGWLTGTRLTYLNSGTYYPGTEKAFKFIEA